MTTDFKITAMTPEILAEKFPDVFQAVKNQGFGIGVEKGTADGFKEGHTKGFCAGAESERQRIKAVEAQSLPGHEALIEQLKADGKTTGEQAAIAVLNAEKEKRKTRLQTLQDGAIPPVPPSSTDADAFKGEDNKNLPVEERTKAEWDKNANVRSEFHSYASFLAYTKAFEAGRAKILTKPKTA